MARNNAFERAVKLAAVSGLRAALGPALLAQAQRRPERHNLAMAALGELVIDKMPLVPSRSTLPLLIPRVLAGAWVAKKVMEQEGVEDPWAPAVGAAVAAGTATFAPLIRGLLHKTLGVPDFMLGLAEDYLAVKLGSEAAGLSIDEIRQVAEQSVQEVKGMIMPAVEDVRGRLMPAS